MHRRESSDCPKCGQIKADLIHCLWACPYIRRFWNPVRDYAIRHLVNYVPLSAAWALWGTIPNIHTKITRGAKRLLLIITAMPKKTILQVWISSTPHCQAIPGEVSQSFLYGLEWYITRIMSGDPPNNL
ncbi:hypothetical protein XELAEV_18002404mg [Xenopus laevis]|nr:hypothetical protein XELAEV_18002404mg [Xenopus laevis]